MEEANYNEIILDADGSVFRRNVIQKKLLLNEDSILAALNEGQRSVIRDAMLVRKFPTSLSVKTDKSGLTMVDATIRLPYLRFNSNFHASGEASCPTFDNPKDSVPRFNVEWDINEACAGKVKLWFFVKTQQTPEGVLSIDNCYIVASSAANRLYRLPLANVYNECRICMGTYKQQDHMSLHEALEAALEQFFISPWNADLIKDRDKSDCFFRFKPENDGFKTLPVKGQWNNLCERVTYPQLDTMVLPQPEGGSE